LYAYRRNQRPKVDRAFVAPFSINVTTIFGPHL